MAVQEAAGKEWSARGFGDSERVVEEFVRFDCHTTSLILVVPLRAFLDIMGCSIVTTILFNDCSSSLTYINSKT